MIGLERSVHLERSPKQQQPKVLLADAHRDDQCWLCRQRSSQTSLATCWHSASLPCPPLPAAHPAFVIVSTFQTSTRLPGQRKSSWQVEREFAAVVWKRRDPSTANSAILESHNNSTQTKTTNEDETLFICGIKLDGFSLRREGREERGISFTGRPRESSLVQGKRLESAWLVSCAREGKGAEAHNIERRGGLRVLSEIWTRPTAARTREYI